MVSISTPWSSRTANMVNKAVIAENCNIAGKVILDSEEEVNNFPTIGIEVLEDSKAFEISHPISAVEVTTSHSAMEIESEKDLSEGMPSSYHETHNYRNTVDERLSHAKRQLAFTKHVSAEDVEEEEPNLEAFNSDDSVADPDFSGTEESDDEMRAASKKKKPNPKKWKRSLEKGKRHCGLKHITKSRRVVEKKYVKAACGNTCRLACSDHISEAVREKIHRQFWTDQKSIDMKRQYIASHVQQVPVQRRRERNNQREGRRQHTNKYFFEVNGHPITVCKKFFLNTLCISQQSVDTAIAKKREGGILSPDKRGRHTPSNKTSPELRESVRNHISQFPVYESHYSRERTKKKYLGNHLNISKMYRLYVEYCKDQEVSEENIAKEWVYSEVFNYEFNYGFKNPDNDTCDNCDMFQLRLREAQTQDMRSSIQQEYDAHLKDAGDRYKLKAEDKQRSREKRSEKVVMIDLQKCLPTPELHNSQSFYSLKLWTYNLVIHDSTLEQAYCMMWDESIAGRGGNEVASCLLKWATVSQIPDSVEELTIWSDNCPSQNRNSQMMMCYFFLLEKNNNLKIINHKFLTKGHTHLEADADHSLIERGRKKTPQLKVVTPWDWQQVARLCGVKKSFHVTGMETNDFVNFKTLRKKTDVGGSFLISHIVHFQVRREKPGTLFYKTKFCDDFLSHNLYRNTRKGNSMPKSLPLIRNCLKNIPTKKFHHLQKLLQWIPQQFHTFYKNLPHGDGQDVEADHE